MRAERFWAAVWVTVFLSALVGVCSAVMPRVPAVQLAVAPAWVAWWALTQSARLGAGAALWGGALLEAAWGVPTGGCVSFFLTLWLVGRVWREALPEELRPLLGLVGGLVCAPALRVWLWLWAVPWLGGEGAAPLRPGLTGLVAAPALGALGGGAVVALARACDFRIFAPPKEETRHAG